MKTDYTVVGRVRNSENILRLVHGIEKAGFSCYNFLHEPLVPEEKGKTWNEQADVLESHEDFWNDSNHQRHFQNDLDALKNADTLILLLPAGLAAHMEAGVAYGIGKKVVLIGEVEKPETLYLMFHERYDDIESFLSSL